MKRKNIYLGMMTAVVFATACQPEKKTEPCDYKLANTPTDTSFYITFELDGAPNTYYQFGHAGYAGLISAPAIGRDSVHTVYSCRNSFEFDGLSIASGDTARPANACLMFFDIQTGVGNKPQLHHFYETVQTANSFTFVQAALGSNLRDTVYMHGVALSLDGKLSTENIFHFYDYKYQDILTTVLPPSGSYLNVTSITQVCNETYIIEGDFETTVTKYYQKPKPWDKNPDPPIPPLPTTPALYRITNGHFRLLTN